VIKDATRTQKLLFSTLKLVIKEHTQRFLGYDACFSHRSPSIEGKVDVVIFLLLEFNTDGIGLAMMHVLTSSTFVFNFYSYNTP